MVNAGVTLVYSVLTFYTFYRYIVQQNDIFEDLSLVHFQWELLFVSSLLTSIYIADQVSSEVSSQWNSSCKMDSFKLHLIHNRDKPQRRFCMT